MKVGHNIGPRERAVTGLFFGAIVAWNSLSFPQLRPPNIPSLAAAVTFAGLLGIINGGLNPEILGLKEAQAWLERVLVLSPFATAVGIFDYYRGYAIGYWTALVFGAFFLAALLIAGTNIVLGLANQE